MEESQPKAASPGAAPAGIPHRVGNYEIVCKVGEGGFGAVYKAWHVELEIFFAIKFLAPAWAGSELFVKRFKREARLAAQLTSPHSVRTLDVGESGGLHYIVMEFINGQTLNDVLERRGRLSQEEAQEIVYGVARALQEAHGKGIVHRDIKPENVMITEDGTPKLADLGIAKQITRNEPNLTSTGFGMGTPDYMSPEQAQGRLDIDARSDIYSLGATLYRMVVGGMPFTGETPLSVMHKIATEPIRDPLTINPAISRNLGAVICKMMAPRREDRYQTMGEVIRHLEALRAGKSPGLDYESTSALLMSRAATASWAPPPAAGQVTRERRNLLVTALAAALALVAAGVFLVPVLLKGRERISPPETPAPKVVTAPAAAPSAIAVAAVPEAAPATTPAPAPATGPATDSASAAASAALAQAKEGHWDAARVLADRTVALAKDNALYRRLKDVVDAGQRAADALNVTARLLAEGGKPPAGYASAENNYVRVRERLGQLDVNELGPDELDVFVQDLDESAEAFGKAVVSVIEEKYPDLQELSRGGNALKGFMALQAVSRKYPDLAAVKQLADKYDPLGEGMAIAAYAARGMQIRSAEEAAQAVKLLDDAWARCDKIAGDPAYKDNVAVLRKQVLQYRIAAFEVAGDPIGMLADAHRLLRGGDNSAKAVADRAVQQFLSKLKTSLDAGPAGAERLIDEAASRVSSSDLAPARTALNDAMNLSDLRRELFRNGAIWNLWTQKIGPLAPPDMVRIPAGIFPLGENYDGLGSVTPSSAPQHDQRIEEFYMDAHEVTNQQFQEFVDAGGYAKEEWWAQARGIDRSGFVDSTGKPGPKGWRDGRYPEGTASLPVAGISWYEASAYAAWALKRLPDEAQWECAAAGEAPAEAGGVFKKSVSPAWAAWGARSRANTPEALQPVGSRPAEKTPLGCFDMVGSLREWTSSRYDKYPGSQCRDGNLGTGLVVVRGVCFNDPVLLPGPALRRGWSKETRSEFIGFRCAWLGPERPAR